MCYYLRLMVGHTAEGFDHVVLQAKDRGKGLYQGAQRQEIQKWVKQDPHLKCLQGEVQQSKATHGTLLKAFRHATFHCLVQYYPGILREMKDVVTSLPNSESVSPSDRPFAELVALPQMHAVHRKCADILEGKKRKKGEPPCVDQWLSDVAADVMGMCGLLQKFALFAARRRAGEKGIGLADAMS